MSIASHVSNITLEKIKIVRMLLNFKISKDDQIIFLWCSSLRIENGIDKKHYENEKVKEIDIGKINVRTPEDINLFKYSISGKPIKPHKDATCLNCDLKVEAYKLYEISFKSLIESHENRKRDKSLFEIYNKINMTSSGIEVIPYMDNKGSDIVEKLRKNNYKNFIVPKVIGEIYPKMKYEDYFNLKKDSIFKAKTACVCESCFLDITRYCPMTGANLENVLRTMKPGSPSLPLVQRNNNTMISAKNRLMANTAFNFNQLKSDKKSSDAQWRNDDMRRVSMPPSSGTYRSKGILKKSNQKNIFNSPLFD